MKAEIKFGSASWNTVGGSQLRSLELVEVNKATGSISFSVEVDQGSQHAYSYNTPVLLRARDLDSDDWQLLFSGKISGVTRAHNAGAAIDSYTAKDVWEELSSIIYLVPWATSQNAFNKSHLTLFRDQTGNRMTVGAQLKAALDYAISKGVPVQYTVADLNALTFQPAADEQTDLTVAEILKKGLRWYPDHFTRIIYAESAADTLRIQPNSARTTVELDAAACLDLSVARRDDLRLNGVSLHYEVCNEELNRTTQSVHTDSAGQADGVGVLVHTAQIDGDYLEPVIHQISFNPEEIPDPWNNNSLDFNSKIFKKGQIDAITYWSRGSTYRAYWVQNWSSSLGNYGITRQTVNVTASFRVKNADGTYTYYTNLSITISTTDTPPGLYSYTQYLTKKGETLPSNIASAFYNARKDPLYQGNFRRGFDLISGRLPLASAVNISGANSDWAAMATPVQSVQRDFMARKEMVQIGIPEHLGLDDYVEMLRQVREIQKSSRRTWRT